MTNYWTTKDKKVLRITDLTNRHLLNIINYFKDYPILVPYGNDPDTFDCEYEYAPDGYEECVGEAKVRGLIKNKP